VIYSGGSPRYRSVVERIVEELAGEVRSGALQPGDRLPSERKLCERFGASRNSVREALRILSSRRMIQIQMGRGSFVTDFSAPETDSLLPFWEAHHDVSFLSLLEVRLFVEPQAAALAAARIRKDQLLQLEATLKQLEENIRDDRLSGRIFADIAFHDCLIRAAENPLLSSFYRGIEPMLYEIRRMGLRSKKRSSKVLEMHRSIYRAVKDGDTGAAGRAMWDHIIEFAVDMEVEFDPSAFGLLPEGFWSKGSK
jgi:GntR family transcriptional regulator, transcriptional repressor for pyruvate dehydrogenase complex